MTKLAAINSRLKNRVADARSRLKFDRIDGQSTTSTNHDDPATADPSRVSELSLDYEGVGNGHGPIIGGNFSS